jgi:hypothetical protein
MSASNTTLALNTYTHSLLQEKQLMWKCFSCTFSTSPVQVSLQEWQIMAGEKEGEGRRERKIASYPILSVVSTAVTTDTVPSPTAKVLEVAS